MSIAVFDQTIANSGTVILGGGGASPYTTAGFAVPYTDIAFAITTNLANNTGSSFQVFGSPDYQNYLNGSISAATWVQTAVYNNTSGLSTSGTVSFSVDSTVTQFTVLNSGYQALKLVQTGSFSGTGTPTVTIKSLSTLAPTQLLPPLSVVSTAIEDVKIMPAQLADFANSATWTLAIPYSFTVLSALFRTGKPASTSGKLTTLTLSTSAGAVTGGVMALTTANQNTTGGTVAASAISGANATAPAGGTIIITPSSTTAFVEGDGWVEITIKNNDLNTSLAAV